MGQLIPDRVEGDLMRLLIVNANTSAEVTQLLVVAAARSASRDSTLVHVTGTFGALVIASRTELAIAQHATVDLLARHAQGFDGVLIAVSYDSGLRAARELLDIPVLGLTESSLLAAMTLGTRVGLIVWGSGPTSLYLEIIDSYGFGGRVCGIRRLDVQPPKIEAEHAAMDEALIRLSRDLVERQEADVIVLIGAVLSGRSFALQDHVAVPVLDGTRCAVPMLEAMIRIGAKPPTLGSYAKPVRRESTGLSDDLSHRLFDGR
jgi:allantoin racemase